MFITSFSQHTSPYLFCFQILHFIILRNLSLGITSLKFRARVYYKYFCFSADICILFPRSLFCSFSECINKCFIIRKGLKRPFLGNNPQKQIPKVNVNIRLQCNQRSFNFVSFCFHFTFVLEIELLSIYLYRSIFHARTHFIPPWCYDRRFVSLSLYLVPTSFQIYPPIPTTMEEESRSVRSPPLLAVN